MKSVFKYFSIASLSGLLCLFLAIPADAQRGGHGGGGGSHGGGGGGFHGGGGGGFHSSGGFSGGRSSGGFSSGRSASAAPSRSFGTPQRSVQNNARVSTNNRTVINNNSRTVIAGRSNAGRVAINGRVGVAGGRTFVGGRGYVGGGAFAARGGYFYNRGFYRSLYYPRLGFRIGYLPYGYYPFWWGDYQYYYSGGYFYNYDNGNYTVVEPPVGAAVNSLPSGAQPITINGQQYYELNGVYYLPITRDDGSVAYQVAGKDGQLDTGDNTNNGQVMQDNSAVPPGTHAAARIGDMINLLPQDSRKVRINGETLFVTPDDVYLKQTTDASGNKVYTVVGTPDQPEE